MTRRLNYRSILLAVAFGLLSTTFTRAQEDTNEIPQIRPLHAELPPTYWEQHCGLIITLSAVVVLAVGLLIWWSTRPRPVIVTPPEILARKALQALPPDLTEGVLLSQVSQILRLYLREAFNLPKRELTTTEFCRILYNRQIGSELARALAEFFRDSDRRKFSLETGVPISVNAVTVALSLIEKSEARRGGPPDLTVPPPLPATTL